MPRKASKKPAKKQWKRYLNVSLTSDDKELIDSWFAPKDESEVIFLFIKHDFTVTIKPDEAQGVKVTATGDFGTDDSLYSVSAWSQAGPFEALIVCCYKLDAILEWELPDFDDYNMSFG